LAYSGKCSNTLRVSCLLTFYWSVHLTLNRVSLKIKIKIRIKNQNSNPELLHPTWFQLFSSTMCDSSFYAAEVQLKFCHVSIKENCFGKKNAFLGFEKQFDKGAQKTSLICTESGEMIMRLNFMRSKFNFFMRSNYFWSWDRIFLSLFMRSKLLIMIRSPDGGVFLEIEIHL
jgi:hypothetical protein